MRNVSQYTTSYGPVKIIPASAIRNDPQQLLQQPSSAQQGGHAAGVQSTSAPYYMGYGNHEPYGQNAFVDYAEQPAHVPPTYSRYYPGYSYSQHAYPGAYGPYPGQSTAYRAYPQPSPPHRRSRTAPARPLHRTGPSISQPVFPAEAYRTRGYSVDAMDRREFTEISGPTKRPQPLYRKRREPLRPTYQETDFGGGPVSYTNTFGPPRHPYHYTGGGEPSMRRIRPYYAPSYTTYPPSTMHRTKRKDKPHKYPLFARVALKAAQLILGAAILGLVLGPMRKFSFHDFVIQTKTEYQGAVVGITASFSILTAILLLTSFLANSVHAWRRLDAHVSWIGSFLYLLCGFIEAYFAACYPPNGPKINLVCHRAEWIIATILLFINVILYLIDFIMSWMSGVNML